MRWTWISALVIVMLAATAAYADAPAITREHIEADWLRQEAALQANAKERPVSAEQFAKAPPAKKYPVEKIIERGSILAERLEQMGVDAAAAREALAEVADEMRRQGDAIREQDRKRLYLRARWAIRELSLSNPLLDFDDILFVKRAPNRYLCHCDEYLSWWSRPGGEVCILENFHHQPRLRSLTKDLLPPGDTTRPELSYDGRRVLFGYCRNYPDLWRMPNKLDKSMIPEDAFYHLYEMNLDGSGGLRRLTHGKYDDFDGRYLPDGQIVFNSTRRGQFLQCGGDSARATNAADLPDSFVRCGGDAFRPVSIHTLHVMGPDGENMRAISPFESFEWNPSVAADGRILYARWDYVDRHKMWHMGLWSMLPNGHGVRAVFGNFTQGPYSFFEARSVPGSQKIVFTASGHHAHAGGALVLLDTTKGVDGPQAMAKLTPEIPYPEHDGWPQSYYANPYPLSEEFYLASWSDQKLPVIISTQINGLGVYLFDAFGNLELLYRDPKIASMCPLPVKPRPTPAAVPTDADWEAPLAEGAMFLQDVYVGDLREVPRGSVQRLRVVGIPPKMHPNMNRPSLGVTEDDPAKFVLGTVPVKEDGSAFFRVPAGMPMFFQALDADGVALQTMRSAAYVPPGKTLSCVGCHDHRQTAPPPRSAVAALREPSKLEPGPEGSWPLSFAALMQPVLDRACIGCHAPGAEGDGAKIDLTAAAAYDTLVNYGGEQSVRKHVLGRYDARRSLAGGGAAATSPLLKLLRDGHYDVTLTADDMERLVIWLDTYGQRTGSSDPDQEEELRELRERLAPLLVERR
jgi:hypothetical protein